MMSLLHDGDGINEEPQIAKHFESINCVAVPTAELVDRLSQLSRDLEVLDPNVITNKGPGLGATGVNGNKWDPVLEVEQPRCLEEFGPGLDGKAKSGVVESPSLKTTSYVGPGSTGGQRNTMG